MRETYGNGQKLTQENGNGNLDGTGMDTWNGNRRSRHIDAQTNLVGSARIRAEMYPRAKASNVVALHASQADKPV